MLQVKNLTITHLKDNRVLLDNFSLTINPGDKAAIIGEEGNGKSTLLKLIYDENMVEDYIEYSGEIIRNNMQIGYLAQELPAREKELSVYEFMCEMPLFFEVTPKELSEVARFLQIPAEIFYEEQKWGSFPVARKLRCNWHGLF